MFYNEGKLTKKGSLAIKGFAILIMLVHHTVLRLEGVDYMSLLPPRVIDGIGSMGRLCVPLFVFVTGYGLMRKGITYDGIWKRIKGIWKTYFICFLFVAIVLCAIGGIPDFSLRNLLGDIFGLQRLFSYEYTGLLPSWWYITTAFVLVIIAPMWIQLVKKYKLGVVIVSIFLPIIFHLKYDGMDILILWLPIYSIGMYVAHIKPEFQKVTKSKGIKTIALFILFALMAVVSYYFCIRLKQGFIFIRMWLSVVPLLFVIYFLCRMKWVSNILVWYGTLSFPMYCTHTLFLNQEVIMNLAEYHWLLPTLVTLVIVTPLAIVINKIVKLLPF